MAGLYEQIELRPIGKMLYFIVTCIHLPLITLYCLCCYLLYFMSDTDLYRKICVVVTFNHTNCDRNHFYTLSFRIAPSNMELVAVVKRKRK